MEQLASYGIFLGIIALMLCYFSFYVKVDNSIKRGEKYFDYVDRRVFLMYLIGYIILTIVYTIVFI